MLIYYDIFYRRFGIRKTTQLTTPPMPLLATLELPKRSILHYYSANPLEHGPASSEFVFRNINKPIYVEHVLEPGDDKGHPRKLSFPVEQSVRKYHIKNRRFYRMRSLEAGIRDDNTLVVYNYGFIDPQYRYMRSFYSEYYKWWNTEAAIWKNIDAVSKQCDRQHFVLLKLPQVLPSVSELKMAVAGMTQKALKVFNDREEWMVLELWKWFGEERADSVLANLSTEALDRVNLVFQESGRWMTFNLGVLNQWRKTPKDELSKVKTPVSDGFDAVQLQRRFLVLLMSLMQSRTEGEAIASDEQVDQDQKAMVEAADAKDAGAKPVELEPGQLEPVETGKDVKQDTLIEKDIEATLAELEQISKTATAGLDDESESATIKETTFAQPALSLEDGVKAVCDRLADRGMLSAAEYRRYNELANSYKNIKSPDGKTTLDAYIKIEPKLLSIESATPIKDIETVTDKSMLKSTLLEFDKRYIEQVMAKDVAAMVLNVQHAGLAVTNYEVERTEDVMGSYDIHTLKLTPVEGSNSTLRFKLPVVDEDGRFESNGVRYSLRKQLGDLPIRKLTPSKVALTSYYGKTFVSRSQKRVNDYGEWLRNSIMAKGLSKEDGVVTNLLPAKVFDNIFSAPKLYTTLAKGFRGFTLFAGAQWGAFDLMFDHTKRAELYGPDTLKQYEHEGAVVVGSNGQGKYLVIDSHDALYVAVNGVLTALGDIEHVLGLESEKAPVEFAELKVLGRTIPVGVVLGYELGLDKLMELLRVVPRRVPAGARVSLQPHEYTLVFSDETLVLSRDDRLAAMMLAGFNEYHKDIRSYSVYEFDKRGVYLNVLEAGGNSARYLREIDLLYQLFVDPITRDLLVEMGEPVDFRGLLKRSCELLLTDQHPDELDPAYMRIKGYERMAGAVYTELVRSIRAHAARPGKAKLPIDLNPYAVWTSISEDPSKAQVSDINPIQNLKEVEAVTFGGSGGRSSRSMTKHTRAYHRNDMGVISESTVDSSDVGINIYTSANPKFTSLRGLTARVDPDKIEPASLLSTSALLSPGSDMDD